MVSIPTWNSWEDVESHTETALLFSEEPLVFGREFNTLIQYLKSCNRSESLTIRGYSDGLNRVEGELERLYGNSAWVIDYSLLFGELRADNSSVKTLRSKLKNDELFPDQTHVFVFVEGEDIAEKDAMCRVGNKYQILGDHTTNNYYTLSGLLRGYFTQKANPEFGECAKRAIYTWSEKMKEVVE